MARNVCATALIAAACLGASPLWAKPTPARVMPQQDIQGEVLAELNKARADPSLYAGLLRKYRGYFMAKLVRIPGSEADVLTEEGVAPVDEAIAFLDRQAGRGVLDQSDRLADAASDHCADQGDDGSVGHVGRDGSSPGDRVARRGGGTYVGEVITYGSTDAVDVIRQLIVDDGVPDRGHRELIFASDVRFAGVSCGPHPTYRTMCVIDFARTRDGRSLAEAARSPRPSGKVYAAMR